MLKRQRTLERPDLKNVSPRYKSKYRLYKSPKYRGPTIYPFKRQVQQTLTINQATGWGGGGFDCGISFSLAQATVFIAGSAYSGPGVPNFGEFTGLFDQYRIKKVNIRLIFSNNESGVNAPNTVLPIVHCFNDYNDTLSKSLSDVQQYPDMKTYQLGTNKDIRWSCVPHCRADVLTNTGALSSSSMNMTSPWIDCTSSTIEHLGARFYMNNLGRNTNVDVGSVLVLMDFFMEFKFVK